MITWADAHRRAAALAAQFHADLDIDLTKPVDVFGAAQALGLVLAFADLGPTSGVYVPGGRSNGILLHAGHPRTRQRYTAGHELGHHVFGHALDIDADLEGELRRSGDSWPDHEKEAESFGAWFLMPRRLLRAGLADLGVGEVRVPHQVYALSLWLGTSYTATARQLGTTRLVPAAQADAFARIPPKEIKAQLAGRFVPDDLRNDVWWLDDPSRSRRLEVRPGDRMVVRLPEVPSSGYSWRVGQLPDGVQVVADSFDETIVTMGDGSDTDPEVAGGAVRHAFVLEVGASNRGVEEVELVLDQAWCSEPAADRLDLDVSVNPPLHGIQVPEHEFRIAS